MKRGLKTLGILIILVGLILIASSSLMSITGNVISESVNIGGSVLGLAFIIGGLALFLVEKGGGLEEKIVRKHQFNKAIRKHNQKKIESAIKKISLGLGKQEMLKHIPHKSIHVDKGYRILYDVNYNTGAITLVDYTDHYK